MTNPVPPPAEISPEREIVSTRLFAVSCERLFQAWLDPQQLQTWWGPRGFTNTFHEFNPTPGGRWHFTMHGPDGKHYPNESIFVEILQNQRIVFDHISQPVFRLIATFEPRENNTQTHLTFRMVFNDANLCSKLKPICVPANEENFDRLERVVGLRK